MVHNDDLKINAKLSKNEKRNITGLCSSYTLKLSASNLITSTWSMEECTRIKKIRQHKITERPEKNPTHTQKHWNVKAQNEHEVSECVAKWKKATEKQKKEECRNYGASAAKHIALRSIMF